MSPISARTVNASTGPIPVRPSNACAIGSDCGPRRHRGIRGLRFGVDLLIDAGERRQPAGDVGGQLHLREPRQRPRREELAAGRLPDSA